MGRSARPPRATIRSHASASARRTYRRTSRYLAAYHPRTLSSCARGRREGEEEGKRKQRSDAGFGYCVSSSRFLYLPTSLHSLRGRELGLKFSLSLNLDWSLQSARAERHFFSTTTSTSTTTPAKMATDEDYMSFLDKANKDPSEGTAKTQGSANGNGKMEFKATEKGVKVPEVIEKVLGKGVAFKLEGKGLPDEATFAKLINHPKPKEADVQIMDVGEWDTQGQYKDLVEATREAVKGSDVRVYRVAKDGSRAEYWLVGVEGGNLVGVKALAVES